MGGRRLSRRGSGPATCWWAVELRAQGRAPASVWASVRVARAAGDSLPLGQPRQSCTTTDLYSGAEGRGLPVLQAVSPTSGTRRGEPASQVDCCLSSRTAKASESHRVHGCGRMLASSCGGARVERCAIRRAIEPRKPRAYVLRDSTRATATACCRRAPSDRAATQHPIRPAPASQPIGGSMPGAADLLRKARIAPARMQALQPHAEALRSGRRASRSRRRARTGRAAHGAPPSVATRGRTSACGLAARARGRAGAAHGSRCMCTHGARGPSREPRAPWH